MRKRDWLVDIVRLAAVAIVVTMHWTYARVTLVDGQLRTVNAYVGNGWRIATWLLMAMPAFFVCGGFSNTVVWDRCHAKGQGYGQYLGLRARRLVTPVIPLILVILVVVTVATRISPGIGRMVGDQVGNVLWFLSVYILCVMIAPAQVWCHDRIGSFLPFLALCLVGLGMELTHRAGVQLDVTYKMFLFWPACHQLGIAFARGTLARVRAWGLILIAVGCSALIAALIGWGGYAPNSIGLRGDGSENIIPPTILMPLLGVAQYALLTLGSRHLQGWEPRERTKKAIGAANAILMPVYLWHLPVLLVITGIGLAFPALLVEDWTLWWLTRPVFFLLALAMLAGIIALVVRWELLMQSREARKATAPVVVGATMAMAAIFLLWRHGILLDATGLGASATVLASLPLLTSLRRHVS